MSIAPEVDIRFGVLAKDLKDVQVNVQYVCSMTVISLLIYLISGVG